MAQLNSNAAIFNHSDITYKSYPTFHTYTHLLMPVYAKIIAKSTVMLPALVGPSIIEVVWRHLSSLHGATSPGGRGCREDGRRQEGPPPRRQDHRPRCPGLPPGHHQHHIRHQVPFLWSPILECSTRVVPELLMGGGGNTSARAAHLMKDKDL